MKRFQNQAGVALPLALMAMLVMLMLGGLFVAYAAPQQQQTARSQRNEGGLHVAESAAELALAALADETQPKQPYEATGVPAGNAGARAWAVSQALSRVTADCTNFERTAGGDGIAVVSVDDGTVYGVSFVPDCQTRLTTRVMRIRYSDRPFDVWSAPNTFLTGGDIYFDHSNSKIGLGGIHSNGSIIGAPNVSSGAPYTASGTCTSPCLNGQPMKQVPNYTARDFWTLRNDPLVNPMNNPFYELCPDGKVQQSPPGATQPCDGTNIIGSPSPHWKFSQTGSGASLKRTWLWDQNAPPPPGQYYAFESNIEYGQRSGTATVSLFAEANRAKLVAGEGNHGGSIHLTWNPTVLPSWPGVFIVADVDVLIDKNVHAAGDFTLVYAREQFRIGFNGKYDRFVFVACDASKSSANFDEDTQYCMNDATTKSTLNSPIHFTRITQNAEFMNPATGTALVPNTGITGVGQWEVL